MNLVSNNLVLIPVKYDFEKSAHGETVEMPAALWWHTQYSLDYRTLFFLHKVREYSLKVRLSMPTFHRKGIEILGGFNSL